MNMSIITHRGLDPSILNFPPESSFAAFQNHLNRGYGIEFDLNFVRDGIIIAHDSQESEDLSVDDIGSVKLKNGNRLCLLGELLEMIDKSEAFINAMHLKGKFQEINYIDRLLGALNKHQSVLNRILLFDLKPAAAEYLKSHQPKLILAPSVAHSYDITRYSDCVYGTLLSMDDAIKYKQMFDWVWLDEWDLNNHNGTKKFYTKENFEVLRSCGYKIALVSPELHGTSPGLLGGESHQDAKSPERLMNRIKEIINLQPDAVCTDYPNAVMNIVNDVL